METTKIPENSLNSVTENENGGKDTILKLPTAHQDYKKMAVEKLDAERKAMKPSANSAVGIMYIETANALRSFCEQNDMFAEVLFKTKRTFADCMEVVAKNPGNGISDIDAYRRAVQFYFPNAQIEFLMNITIAGDAPDEAYIQQEAPKKKTTSSKPKKDKKPADKAKEKTKATKKPESKTETPPKKEKPASTTMQLSLF